VESTVESLAREAIEAFNRVGAKGNFRIDDRTRALWVEDPVIVPLRAALEGIEYRGPTALDDFSTANAEAWESLRIDVEDIREAGEDAALIYGTVTGVARETGIETNARVILHMVLQEGRIASMRTYLSEADALREASR
jgi:ketosteroid isomerase-like protein